MNNLILTDQMSTKDFVTLTGSDHTHVIAKTTKLLTDLGFDLDERIFVHEEFQVLTDKRGYKTEILLNRDLSLTLAGQYKPKVAYKVAQRFNKPMTTMDMIIASATETQRLQDVTTKHDKRLDKLETLSKQPTGDVTIHKHIHKVGVMSDLAAGLHTIEDIKLSMGWKPASATLVRLLDAHGFTDKHKRKSHTYYNSVAVSDAINLIVAASVPKNQSPTCKTLTYQGINYIWYK